MSFSKKIFRIILVLFILVLVFGLLYFILRITGVWEQLNSVEKLQAVILELGFWGRLTFVFLQFLQVTFIPLPSPILIMAGSLIYGPFEAGLLSLSGILLGSAFAFFLGKAFGKKIVTFMVGKEQEKKWRVFLTNCKYSFFIIPFNCGIICTPRSNIQYTIFF